MAFTLPRLPLGNYTPQQFQVWWQLSAEAIERNSATQDQAIADIQMALETARSRMPAVADVTIQADSSGMVSAGQLPRNVAFKRYSLDTDVTTSSAWTATLLTGAATFTIGAADGVLQLTALGSTSTIEVKSVKSAVPLTAVLTVLKSSAPPAPPAGGGTTASDSALTPITSASHAPVSVELTVMAGSGGNVTLNAPTIVVTTAAATPGGTFPVYGKWQWDSTGAGVWVDVAAEVINAASTQVTFVAPSFWDVDDGYLSVSTTKTGLTPASSHKFRLVARNSSGTRTMYLSGTATATGS